MVKEINLAKNKYDSNIGTLADNESLQIKINGKTYLNAQYYLKAQNGEHLFNLLFVDNIVEIPRQELTYGIFKAKVVVMVDNKVVREFEVENLLLKELEGEFKIIPEFEEVKCEFESVQEKCRVLEDKILELETLCENTKELVLKLNGLTQKVGV